MEQEDAEHRTSLGSQPDRLPGVGGPDRSEDREVHFVSPNDQRFCPFYGDHMRFLWAKGGP
ncbi:hypothetical protein GCM10027187_21410 [Streptosporangium sandarakinum]